MRSQHDYASPTPHTVNGRPAPTVRHAFNVWSTWCNLELRGVMLGHLATASCGPSTAAGGIRPDESSQRVSTLNRHRCVGRAWFINCTQRHRGSGCGCQSARHRYALRRVCQRLRSGNWRSSVTRVSIPRLPDAAQTSLVKADLRMGAQGLQTPIGGLPRRTIGAPAVRIAHPVTPITPRKTMPNGSVRADC